MYNLQTVRIRTLAAPNNNNNNNEFAKTRASRGYTTNRFRQNMQIESPQIVSIRLQLFIRQPIRRTFRLPRRILMNLDHEKKSICDTGVPSL